jgi:hypothetical protein
MSTNGGGKGNGMQQVRRTSPTDARSTGESHRAATPTAAPGRRVTNARSPWRNGPMCEGQNAMKSFHRYVARGKAGAFA